MGRMDFFSSLFSTRIAETSWCQQSGSISPHARQTAECINEYNSPRYFLSKRHPTAFHSSTEQKNAASIFFSQNKTHDHAASFKDRIIMLLEIRTRHFPSRRLLKGCHESTVCPVIIRPPNDVVPKRRLRNDLKVPRHSSPSLVISFQNMIITVRFSKLLLIRAKSKMAFEK